MDKEYLKLYLEKVFSLGIIIFSLSTIINYLFFDGQIYKPLKTIFILIIVLIIIKYTKLFK